MIVIVAEKTNAEVMSEKQREISVSEFFTKNRHLLGFDNPRKALLVAVKEAVDNSLDACEEARILPEIRVELKQLREDRFQVMVEDNGPGIVKKQVPRIFGKLLYGSKFHKMSQTRGQQGIGISAAAMYGQLTTGKPIKVFSKIGPKHPAYYCELSLNTKKNEPEILKEQDIEWNVDHGTKLELEIEAKYVKGKQSVDEYIKQTAIANPHLTLVYIDPENQRKDMPRVVNKLPIESKEIKPHPYGIELGLLIKMLKESSQTTLQAFLEKEFCRVSATVAHQICETAALAVRARPATIAREQAEKLYEAIQKTKIIAPPTNCLSPITEELLLKSLQKEIEAEFYATTTRPPTVYRGNPFQIEAGIAYGGSIDSEGSAIVLRFANRVPLQYQQGSCAIQKAIVETAWKNYGVSQSRNSLPNGPVVIAVHIASVWVPFTSESKEAIANYPEIIKEIKLALQDCGRKLASHVRKRHKIESEIKRKKIFELYIDELIDSLAKLQRINKQDFKKILTKMADEYTTKGEEEVQTTVVMSKKQDEDRAED